MSLKFEKVKRFSKGLDKCRFCDDELFESGAVRVLKRSYTVQTDFTSRTIICGACIKRLWKRNIEIWK